jgi:hypothetical protein
MNAFCMVLLVAISAFIASDWYAGWWLPQGLSLSMAGMAFVLLAGNSVKTAQPRASAWPFPSQNKDQT